MEASERKSQKTNGIKARVKEYFRKQMVSLKRRPSKIPFFMLIVCLLVFMLNLTNLSNTTAVLNSPNMGLTNFVALLLAILGLVTFMNSFPKRKKVHIPMLVLSFVFIAIIIVCDIFYYLTVQRRLNEGFQVEDRVYIYAAQDALIAHLILLGISVLLIVTLPLIKKLLSKINTTVHADFNEDIEDTYIEIED